MHTNHTKYLNSTLAQFGEILNRAGLLWGVGASAMLHQYGLAESPNDIDIIVAEKDIEAADKILSLLGSRQEINKSDFYATDNFYEYHLPLMDVDVMCGYKIILPDKRIYSYLFDAESIPTSVRIENEQIPFTTLEDWYVLYQLMPNRETKARIVEDFLKENGVKHPLLLQRMLNNEATPDTVRERSLQLL